MAEKQYNKEIDLYISDKLKDGYYDKPCTLNGYVGECQICPDANNRDMSCFVHEWLDDIDEHFTELS